MEDAASLGLGDQLPWIGVAIGCGVVGAIVAVCSIDRCLHRRWAFSIVKIGTPANLASEDGEDLEAARSPSLRGSAEQDAGGETPDHLRSMSLVLKPHRPLAASWLEPGRPLKFGPDKDGADSDVPVDSLSEDEEDAGAQPDIPISATLGGAGDLAERSFTPPRRPSSKDATRTASKGSRANSKGSNGASTRVAAAEAGTLAADATAVVLADRGASSSSAAAPTQEHSPHRRRRRRVVTAGEARERAQAREVSPAARADGAAGEDTQHRHRRRRRRVASPNGAEAGDGAVAATAAADGDHTKSPHRRRRHRHSHSPTEAERGAGGGACSTATAAAEGAAGADANGSDAKTHHRRHRSSRRSRGEGAEGGRSSAAMDAEARAARRANALQAAADASASGTPVHPGLEAGETRHRRHRHSSHHGTREGPPSRLKRSSDGGDANVGRPGSTTAAAGNGHSRRHRHDRGQSRSRSPEGREHSPSRRHQRRSGHRDGGGEFAV